MASLTRPVTEEEWNVHKAAIHSLFLCHEVSLAQLVKELAYRGLLVTFVLLRPRILDQELINIQQSPAGV